MVAKGRTFSSTVAEDVSCLKMVSLAFKQERDKLLKPNKSLENLAKLDSLGMLDIYVILFIHGGDNSPEYETFREKHRERMLKFLIEYFADENQLETKNIG